MGHQAPPLPLFLFPCPGLLGRAHPHSRLTGLGRSPSFQGRGHHGSWFLHLGQAALGAAGEGVTFPWPAGFLLAQVGKGFLPEGQDSY